MDKITFPVTLSMQGAQVAGLQAALQMCLDRRILLPDDERVRRELADRLKRERATQTFGEATSRLVTAFQSERHLEPHGEVDERTANALNALLTELGLLDHPRQPSPPKPFVVKGHVRQADGTPLVGATVKAFDKNLRGETLLAEAVTSEDGSYEIRYEQSQLVPSSKSAADVIVRAFSTDGAESAHSEDHCHAPAEVVVDLVVGNVKLRGPSEYDQLRKAIKPYLNGIPLGELQRADVQYLNCSAGVDRRQIATLIVANRLTTKTSLPDWFFYALGRQGVLLDLSALIDQGAKSLRESVDRAIATNIVRPLDNPAELDRLMDQLKSVLLKTAFEPSSEAGVLSVGELVGSSLVSREIQENFLSRYLARKDSLEDFWQELQADESFDPKAREDLRFTFHLGMLTQFNGPLMKQLKSLRERGELQSLRDLAGFDRKRWRQQLQTIGRNGEIILPANIPGKTPEERLNHYISTLREPIETLFPSDSLRRAFSQAPNASPGVKTFLNNTPMLDLYWGDVDKFVSEQATTAFAGVEDEARAGVVEEIKTLQRLLRVAPSADQVTILRQADFKSAYSIARTSREHFRSLFVDKARELKDSLDGAYMVLPEVEDGAAGDTPIMMLSGETPEALADRMFNQASGRAAASLYYLVNARMFLEPLPFSLGGSRDVQEQAKKEFLAKNPQLETLFGSLSYCECQHCRSVYSPAAYLVDLLHWLEAPNEKLSDPLQNAKGPIRALLTRRPDLAKLALTCENTNTPLPYVDVVNEVLESFIQSHLDGDGNWTDSSLVDDVIAARDTGEAKADELRAVPQYVIPKVYDDHLSQKAIYPMTLPFHRSLEVVRAYLDHLGTSRARIMEQFQSGTPPTPSDEDISAESLGLNPALAHIITANPDAGTKDVWLYYGFATEALFVNNVVKVPEFLTRTGLSMEELVALLKTRFINPHLHDQPQPPVGKVISIAVDPKDPCDVSKMTIKDLTWVDNEVVDKYQWLKRIHRFLRLWRVLGWSMADLDAALHTFKSTVNNDVLHDDASILQRLEAVNWLHQELDVSVPALLAFWFDLDTWGEDSTYASLFLIDSVTPKNADSGKTSLAELFKLNPTGTDLADTTKNLSDNLATVFATLQLTTADYDAIATQEFSATPLLNLKNLSILSRYGTLARSLSLRVKDIATLIRLVPDDYEPFHEADAIPARRFVRLVRTIEQTSFSVPLINYLFRHEVEPTRHPAPTRVLVFTSLKTIAEGLAQIAQETEPTDDPNGELLRKQLAALQSLLTPLKAGEESKWIKPDEVDKIIDMIDWRRSDFDQTLSEAFLQKFHDKFLNDFDSSFFGPNLAEDKTALFESPPSDEAARNQRFTDNLTYVRNKFLPWLRARLQRNHVYQTLAAALAVDESVMKALLDRVLQSTVPAQTKPALSDFLDLPALNEFLKLVKEKGGSKQFDVLNDNAIVVRTFVRVFKAVQIVNNFEITEAELDYLSQNGPSFENFSFNALPLELTQTGPLPKQLFRGWIALERFTSLRNSLPKSEKTLVDILSDKSVETLVEATGWDKEWVNSLQKLPPDGVGLAPSFAINDLIKLKNGIELIKRAGVPAKTLLLWAQNEPQHAQAEEVIEAVKSRYDRKHWLEVARSLNDPLREKQRDALVNFLVARMSSPHPLLKRTGGVKDSVKDLQRKLNFALASLQPVMPAVLPLTVDGIFGEKTETAVKAFQQINNLTVDGLVGPATWAALDRAVGLVFDRNKLLEHFLIDIEMSSCMLTSRIKQAISSVQMFVQRCLLNLEPEVSPGKLDPEQWQWMKNYRVWEANRKVFLYPENWIEPELRDDKTPFFRELETELLQNELTDQTVEQAIINYLYRLHKVARLDIRGFCKVDDAEENEETYHVFGRTWNPPFAYYYRWGKYPKNEPLAIEWSPWQSLELDIQSDHLIPAISGRRLFLLWPMFDEKPDPVLKDVKGDPKKALSIRLAVAIYESGKWVKQGMSKEVLLTDIFGTWFSNKGVFGNDLGPEARAFCALLQSPGDITLDIGAEDPTGSIDLLFGNGVRLGQFVLSDCNGSIAIKVKSGSVSRRRPGNNSTLIEHERFATPSGNLLVEPFSNASFSPVLIPKEPSAGFIAVTASNDVDNDEAYPFFVQDGPAGFQNYFARPINIEHAPVDVTIWEVSTKSIDATPTMNKSKSQADPIMELVGIAISPT